MIDLSKFKILFIDTLKREYRSKMLIFVFILTIAVMLLVNFGVDFVITMVDKKGIPFNLGEQKITVFYFIINKWTTILSIIFGVNCIQSDFESDVIPQLLSLPVRRFEYLAARIIGSSFIVSMYYIVSLLIAVVVFYTTSKGYQLEMGAIFALVPTMAVIFSVILISVLFSFFFNKIFGFICALLMSLVINISNSSLAMTAFSDLFKELGFIKIVGVTSHLLFPRIGNLHSITNGIMAGNQQELSFLVESSHFIFSCSLLFFVIHLIFKKREV